MSSPVLEKEAVLNNQYQDVEFENVPCAFCGLGCDDLKVKVSGDDVDVIENGCSRSVRLFKNASAATDQCYIEGQVASFDQALKKAAHILSQSKQPFIGGLATDVAGMRSVMALADKVGATVDHMSSKGLFNNLLATQNQGYFNTTYTEVRNRADIIVIAGTSVINYFPRFFERLIRPDGMFVESTHRKIIAIGEVDIDFEKELEGHSVEIMACKNRQLGEIFKAVSSLVSAESLQANEVAGMPISKLQNLANQLLQASYGVIVWAGSDLNFPHAELTIQTFSALIKTLNKKTRFAGLPLSGNYGDITANHVCTWQTGFPLRTSFAAGKPDYDPYQYSLENLLKKNQLSSLLWISSFEVEKTLPVSSIPTVVLGRAGMEFQKPPTVYIPVATPGIHHVGNTFRGDSAVSLRLRKIVSSPLLPVHEVLSRLIEEL